MTTTEAKEFYDIGDSVLDIFDKAFIDSVNSDFTVNNCHLRCKYAQIQFDDLLALKSPFNLLRFNKFLNVISNTSIDNTELLELCYK